MKKKEQSYFLGETNIDKMLPKVGSTLEKETDKKAKMISSFK